MMAYVRNLLQQVVSVGSDVSQCKLDTLTNSDCVMWDVLWLY